MVECELEEEEEEEDDWVVVKKQKITILVPPSSPLHPQSMSLEMNQKTQPKIVKRSSGARQRREHELTKDKHEEASATPAPANDLLAVGIGIISSEEPICNAVAFPEQLKQPFSVEDNGNRKVIAVRRKSVSVPRAQPIGALNVVNQTMRARNLERRLEGMGGLRRWLVSQGLERFLEVFERAEVGKYELVNLTMSMLKDMGTEAVGPRRKLIHAIDRLSFPYYFKAAR